MQLPDLNHDFKCRYCCLSAKERETSRAASDDSTACVCLPASHAQTTEQLVAAAAAAAASAAAAAANGQQPWDTLELQMEVVETIRPFIKSGRFAIAGEGTGMQQAQHCCRHGFGAVP